jgi:hypothetical protein
VLNLAYLILAGDNRTQKLQVTVGVFQIVATKVARGILVIKYRATDYSFKESTYNGAKW